MDGLGTVHFFDLRQSGQGRGDHKYGLTSGPQDQQRLTIPARQSTGGHRCGGAGTHGGDIRGVHDPQRQPRFPVHGHKDAAERRQPQLFILWECCQCLQAVYLTSAVIAGADIHDAAAILKVVGHSRPDNGLPPCLGTINALHSFDHLRQPESLFENSAVIETDFHNDSSLLKKIKRTGLFAIRISF